MNVYEVLGDEYHFLLQCTKHQDLRSKLHGTIGKNHQCTNLLLMSSQRKVVIIKLAAFVHIGLQRENV